MFCQKTAVCLTQKPLTAIKVHFNYTLVLVTLPGRGGKEILSMRLNSKNLGTTVAGRVYKIKLT